MTQRNRKVRQGPVKALRSLRKTLRPLRFIPGKVNYIWKKNSSPVKIFSKIYVGLWDFLQKQISQSK
jgi:hypothetical protein